MAHGQLKSVLQHIRQLAGNRGVPDTPDAELLDRFARHREEAAFATLLRRHGPLVLGICRRVLNDAHEAEDAFQATFLILARKAAVIRKPELLNNWLYGVAYRVARRARLRRQRQVTGQENVVDRTTPASLDDLDRQLLLSVLDEELSRLPDKYRVPILLCCIEGKSQEAAARHLGWSGGSVKGRLERARELLRSRLTRRGVILSASALTAVLAENATAEITDRLATATIGMGLRYAAGETALGPAAVLAQEALRTFAMLRIHILAVLVLVASIFAGGAAWLLITPSSPAPTNPAVAADRPKPAAAEPPRQRQDLFGDALPAGADVRLGTVRWRPGQQTNGLAASADGTSVAAANEGGLSLWDTDTGKQLQVFGRQPRVEETTFLPDGSTLASRSGTAVSFWDIKSGKLLRQFEPKPAGAESFINDCLLSANGRVLAAIGNKDQTYSLNIYEVGAEQARQRWQVKEMPFRLALSADGKRLATQEFTKEGNVLRLWDTAAGKEIQRFGPTKQSIWRLSLSGDGRFLASGGHEDEKEGTDRMATVLVWDVRTGKLQHTLSAGAGFAGDAYAVAFSPDSRLLAACGGDNSVRLWQVDNGKELQCCRGHDYAPHAIIFSPDGKTVIAGDNASTIRLWDVATGKEVTPLRGHHGWIEAVGWLAGTDTVVTLGDKSVRVWNAISGAELRRFAGVESSGVHCAAFCPAKRLLAAVTYPYKEIQLWDLDAEKIIRRIPTAEGTSTVLFAADGRLLAGLADSTIFLWDSATGKEVHQLRGHKDGVGCASFSADGRLLASGGRDNDKTVRLWDVATGRELHCLAAPEAPEKPNVKHFGYGPDALAFAPDGKTIAACGSDTEHSYICIWDVATGRELRKIRPRDKDRGDRLFFLAFAPDGQTLATGGWDKEVHLWEVATATEARELHGHRGGVLTLAFSADGRRLLTGSQDTTALIWDLVAPTPEEAARAARLTAVDLDSLWNELAAADAADAHRAVRILTAAPNHSLPLLRERLKPAATLDPQTIERLVADLDSAQFEVRRSAVAGLEKLEDRAVPAVEKGLAGKTSLELRKRLEQLVDRLKGSVPSAEVRRSLRAVTVLEHVGNVEAREVLAGLAKGAPEARQTREARAALQRLR